MWVNALLPLQQQIDVKVPPKLVEAETGLPGPQSHTSAKYMGM